MNNMSKRPSILLKENVDKFNATMSPRKISNRPSTAKSQSSNASASKIHESRAQSAMALIVMPGGSISPRTRSDTPVDCFTLPPGSVIGSPGTEETDFTSMCGSSDHGDSETVGSTRSLRSPTAYKLESNNNEEEIEDIDLSPRTVSSQKREEEQPKHSEGVLKHSPPSTIDVVDEYSKYADDKEEGDVPMSAILNGKQVYSSKCKLSFNCSKCKLSFNFIHISYKIKAHKGLDTRISYCY